jgi:lycopene cyclase domain-containing protein
MLLGIPLAASIYLKTPFYQHWKNAGLGLLITTVFFILWSELFTELGVWSFNKKYVTGIYFGSLPFEEGLFFVSLAYAGMFLYFALNHFFEKDRLFPHQEIISSVLIIVLMILGLYHKDKLYTGSAFLLLAVFLAFQMLKLRPRYMGRFYSSFAIMVIVFAVANAVRTGAFIDEEIIHYNNVQTLNASLGTIPLEDFCFVMLLMVMPITIWEWLEDYFYYKRR